MAGTYLVTPPAGYADYSGARESYQMHLRLTASTKVIVKSAYTRFGGKNDSNSALNIFEIYRVSDATLLHSQNFFMNEGIGNVWQELTLNTPFVMLPGVEYSMGWNTHSLYRTLTTYDSSGMVAGPLLITPTPTPSFTITAAANTYYNTGNPTTMPTAQLADTAALQLGVDLNTAPTAPTNLAATNSPVPTGTSPALSWTFNDPDAGNAQGKYQIRWRKKD